MCVCFCSLRVLFPRLHEEQYFIPRDSLGKLRARILAVAQDAHLFRSLPMHLAYEISFATRGSLLALANKIKSRAHTCAMLIG